MKEQVVFPWQVFNRILITLAQQPLLVLAAPGTPYTALITLMTPLEQESVIDWVSAADDTLSPNDPS